MSLKSAFNSMLLLKGRDMVLTRPLTPTDLVVTVKIAQSDYYRKEDTVSDASIRIREFVISKDALEVVSFPRPKRGDKITDGENGTHTLTDIREMVDLGGAVMGYRCRSG